MSYIVCGYTFDPAWQMLRQTGDYECDTYEDALSCKDELEFDGATDVMINEVLPEGHYVDAATRTGMYDH